MKVKDTLNTFINHYYGEDGGSPIYDITPYLDYECSIEIYEDDDGYDEECGLIIRRTKECFIKGVKGR